MRGRFCRGRPNRPPPAAKGGASLVELLVVLYLLAVLAGGVSLIHRSSFPGGSSAVRALREGENAAAWLQRIFYKALLSGRSFVVRISSAAPQARIKVSWSSPGGEDVYDGRGNAWFLNHSSKAAFCTYSPRWNTISPAFTIRVTASPGKYSALAYIVVSPYCRVSYRDTPPRD